MRFITIPVSIGCTCCMPLPGFNEFGDLPAGIYRATLEEVTERFGTNPAKRGLVTKHLTHIHELAKRTNHLERFILFGSYITAKPEPNDVDVILVMDNAFALKECPIETAGLFDQAVAQARYGASIFWIRPAALINESVEDFIAYWQIKRDNSHRGIVEVIDEETII